MADLHLHRVLKAPRADVWRCWTDPAHLPRWFAPAPVATRVVAMDLRPGGIFHTVMSMDGTDFPSDAGCFLEVVADERLTFTNVLGPDFRPLDPASLPFGFTATITLADHAEGTDYRVVVRHMNEASAAQHEAMGFTEGWGTAADQLGAYAATLAQTRER